MRSRSGITGRGYGFSSGLEYPLKRVTVNLAPAAMRKSGSGLELAIALAVTTADETLPAGVLDGIGVLGELGLDGAVRPVVGTLSLVDSLVRSGVECVVVPAANLDAEADALADTLLGCSAVTLRAVKQFLHLAPEMPANGASGFAAHLAATALSARF